MRGSQGYRTRQRELIWNYLCDHRAQHIVAEDIVEHLRAIGEPVGKSTVYRYLERLVEEGQVRKFFLEEGMSACYQLAAGEGEDCHEHFHLKCLRCGRLLHIECEYLSEVEQHIFGSHRFRVDNTKTVLYGICEDCALGEEKA